MEVLLCLATGYFYGFMSCFRFNDEGDDHFHIIGYIFEFAFLMIMGVKATTSYENLKVKGHIIKDISLISVRY